jgi:hypothetical protein
MLIAYLASWRLALVLTAVFPVRTEQNEDFCGQGNLLRLRTSADLAMLSPAAVPRGGVCV